MKSSAEKDGSGGGLLPVGYLVRSRRSGKGNYRIVPESAPACFMNREEGFSAADPGCRGLIGGPVEEAKDRRIRALDLTSSAGVSG